MAFGYRFDKMLRLAGASRRDDRYAHCVADRPKNWKIVSIFSSVAVHRRARSPPRREPIREPKRPLRGPSGASAINKDFPEFLAVLHNAFRVDINDHALASEFLRRRVNEVRSLNCGRIDRNLVYARVQNFTKIFDRPDTAPDRQGDTDGVRRRPDEVDDDVALLVTRRDIKKNQLVCALKFIASRNLDGVARVAEV